MGRNRLDEAFERAYKRRSDAEKLRQERRKKTTYIKSKKEMRELVKDVITEDKYPWEEGTS